jgi:glycosyltransferase involved in cell wall biosynthesis
VIRLASLPEAAPDDIYYRLFYGALRRYGIVLVPEARYDLQWFRENRGRIDWVHFHWVQSYYMSWNLPRIVWGTARFLQFLVRLRRMGYRLAWTCHNLFPHESRSRLADYVVRLALARMSEIVIVHSRRMRSDVGRWFLRRKNVYAVPHGHFIGCYPNGISREAARRRLGLSERSFVYLFFGIVRPYKGVEELIDGFRAAPEKDSVLIVAGKPMSEAYAGSLTGRAEGDSRIRLALGHVVDEDLQAYFNAADLTVLPFRKISTSGSLLLALSFGSPVIIPDVASIREYVNRQVAYVMKPDESLAGALGEARRCIERGELRSGPPVIEWARRFDWDEAAAILGPLLGGKPEA